MKKKITLSKIVNFFIALAQKTGGEVLGEKDSTPELISKARALAGEGIVLLKNDGTLPFDKEDVVSVFGRVQNDYFYVGYGSGGDVKAPYRVSLMEGLRGADVRLNEELASVYSDWCEKNPTDEGFWGHWPLCYEEMPLTDAFVEKQATKSSVALVVIGRAAGEDREQKLVKGGYLITDDEKIMLNFVTARFKKVVVLIDAGNVMDMSWVKEYGDRLSAIVYAWQGGMESGNAVADVLTGKVNPSGKLTDTVAMRYIDYPSASNFGRRKSNTYVEDIYVGYRYFSTFGNDSVVYPFGYGLSYTTFEKTSTLTYDDGEFTLETTVKNVGDREGKEVVFLYVNPPQGKLGKPFRNLVTFKKTGLIAPGESETVIVKFGEKDIASYDDGGRTGHKNCFVLEDGEYAFFVGGDYISAEEIARLNLKEKVVEECEEACAPKAPFDVAHPHVSPTGAVSKKYHKVATATVSVKDRIMERLPDAIPQNIDLICTLDDVKAGNLSVEEFVGTLTDEELEVLARGQFRMNSPLGTEGNAGAFGGTEQSLKDRGIPAAITTDGPSGIRLAHYASLLPCGTAIASSMNEELAEETYLELGKEMIRKGSDMLLGPGMNIHRDPLCGRNFEYFSEDPVVSGKIAAAIVRGIQSAGVSACPKHFACNNQETNRNHTDTRVSQRALREIYLRGFEICVNEGKPLCMMTSYNKINGIFSYYNYDLATTVLRKDWSYDGMLVTDWWTVAEKSPDWNKLKHHAYRVRAQVDVVMPGGDRIRGKYDGSAIKGLKDGVLTRAELQRSAVNVLNFLLANESTRKRIQ